MKIIDTYSSFPNRPSIEQLREYHRNYQEIFSTYFSSHCRDTDERLNEAIERYSADWKSINSVHQSIKYFIEDVAEKYQIQYQVEFPITINLIIGAYGSNAYAHREIIPDITFAMERLTFEEEPLRVIVAHELGHVAHNIISDRHQMDWKTIQWEHPYIWLLQEGAATHFSKKIAPEMKESIYFSYDYNGEEWLEFAENNERRIISRFANVLQSGKNGREIYKEWFSINGGNIFGFSRLGYYIADVLFQDLVKHNGELDTLLLWKEEGFFAIIDEWLNQY